MADKKISQLTGAATPLAGTEVLPIVQSGTTVKVSVADLTAGRAVSAASLTPSGSTIPTNGFYLPSADTVGVATASTLRGVVSSTGNFGFGLSTPQYRVDVQNQSAINSFQASFGATMGAGSWTGIHIGYKEANNTTYRKGAIAFEAVDNDARGTIHILNNGAASAASATLADSKLSVAFGGNVTVPVGNLVVGTAGRGIDFSANANAPGMTSEVLNWYEEGTWTPTMTSASGTTTVNSSSARYTRIGDKVFVVFQINYSTDASVSTSNFTIGGLPFTSRATFNSRGFVTSSNWTGSDLNDGALVVNAAATTILWTGRAVNQNSRTNAILLFSADYFAA